MGLAVIPANELDELSDEQTTLIAENKTEMTPAELKTTELEGDDDQACRT